ncbi:MULTISPECIES: hypothetical protein [unclassified Curtobacterium]|uniref:hypothetical protein n=1 Tax=unclassified Curtobacterium TaxID=257496 RepID=UPI003A80D3C3
MDTKAEVRDFLRSRRARVTPQQVRLPDFGGGARRVRGLQLLADLAATTVAAVPETEDA